mmetsp:Transcript_124621/g.338545  ORF Transcript_124621/g.338545 Transcript_124621/m.338545 type:complete len:291 (-) Transcript_124621:350-1222(-)
MGRSSWLPRTSQTCSGYATLSASRSPIVSSWCSPRSTKSPLKTKDGPPGSPGVPYAWNSKRTSRSCPCRSPKMRQGAEASASTGCTASSFWAAFARTMRTSRYSGVSSSDSTESWASSVLQLPSMQSGSSATLRHICLAPSTIRRARLSTRFQRPMPFEASICFLVMKLLMVVVMARTRKFSTLPASTPHLVTTSTVCTLDLGPAACWLGLAESCVELVVGDCMGPCEPVDAFDMKLSPTNRHRHPSSAASGTDNVWALWTFSAASARVCSAWLGVGSTWIVLVEGSKKS